MSGDKTPPGRDGRLAGALQVRLGEVGTLEGRIAEIVRAVPGRIAFSTSLGLEDQAILHAIAQRGAEIDVFTLDTGRHVSRDAGDAGRERAALRPAHSRAWRRMPGSWRRLVARDGVLGLPHFGRGAQGLLRRAQGAPSEPRSRRCRRLDHRTAARPIQPAAARLPFAAWDDAYGLIKVNPMADWSAEQLEAYIAANDVPGQSRCTRAAFPRSAASPARARSGPARTSAPAAGGGRTRTARSAGCTRGRRASAGAARMTAALTPSRPARGREHPHFPRGCRAVPPAGAALFDRQGFHRAAAPGAQGVLSGQAAVPAAACRHHLEVPRHDRLPRSHGARARPRPDRAHQPGGRRARHQPGRLPAIDSTPT